MLPQRIEEPKKYDLEDVMKLVEMLDFLKGKLKPFSHISYGAVRRGIIREDEKGGLYSSFTRVTKRVNLFEGEFFPEDQSSSGRSRWAYRIPDDMTKEEFIKRISDYAKKYFKKGIDFVPRRTKLVQKSIGLQDF